VVLIIKPIESTADIKAVVDVEAEAWGMDRADTVPEHVLTAVAREGGVLLGAYEGERLIGFTLGWLGTVDPDRLGPAAEQLKLVSHMTGVLSGYRDRRVGFQLKLAQREWALSQKLDLVTWTYDPLESRNGYLNIHLLGCTCRTYLRDYYGQLHDELNAGSVPLDRFRVDWWIKDPRVEDVLAADPIKPSAAETPGDLILKGFQLINPAVEGGGAFLQPAASFLHPESPGVLVEIPSDMQAMRAGEPDLALSWRLHTREIFDLLFREGYRVVDFIFRRYLRPRSYYLLERAHED
jgi:predicted GNAT superfamily acetyltransferase